MHQPRCRSVAVVVTVSACAWLCSCGRLGFSLLPEEELSTDPDASPPPPAADAAAAGGDASPPPAPRDAATGGSDASGPPAPTDASADASDGSLPPLPPLDAGDASLPSVRDATPEAAPPDAAIPPGDFCETIPPLGAQPLLDGVLEPGLSLRRPIPVGWTGASPIPSEHDAAYAVAWLPDALYFFVAVETTTRLPAPPGEPVHCGDSIELYVDSDGAFPTAPSYDVPGTIQFVISAPATDVDPMQRGQRWNNVTLLQGDWASTEFTAVPTVDGYAVEALIRAADLGMTTWTLTAGASVGLALGINLSAPAIDAGGGCPARLGQYFSSIAAVPGGCGVGPFCTTDAFCVAPLLP